MGRVIAKMLSNCVRYFISTANEKFFASALVENHLRRESFFVSSTMLFV